MVEVERAADADPDDAAVAGEPDSGEEWILRRLLARGKGVEESWTLRGEIPDWEGERECAGYQ
jgi:hypothetical protein